MNLFPVLKEAGTSKSNEYQELVVNFLIQKLTNIK